MNRQQYINKIANLSNNLNNKRRQFIENEYGNLYDYKMNQTTAEFDRKINFTMDSGYFTKSKKEIGKLNDKDLEKLYNKLYNLQHNDTYGTVKKYKIYENAIFDKSARGIMDIIGEEKYNKLKGDMSQSEFIKEFIKRKNEEMNSRGATYSSTQILEQMYLEQLGEGEEKENTMRALKRLERAREVAERGKVSNKRVGGRKLGNRAKRR